MPASDTYARFYVHPQLQGDDTIKAGGPRYKDVVYIEIFIKGTKNTSFSRPKREQDEADYPKAWQAFKDNSFELTDGTPISVLPGIGPSQAMDLKSLGIMSVEEMADLSDQAAIGNPGMVTLRKRAQAYLAASAVQEEEPEPGEPVNVEEMEGDASVVPAQGNQGLTSILEDTVPNIVNVLDDLSKSDLDRLRKAERSGKGRKGLIKEINERLKDVAA